MPQQPRFIYRQLAPDSFVRYDSLRNTFDIVTSEDVPPLTPMSPDAVRLSLAAQHEGDSGDDGDEFGEFEDDDPHFGVDVDCFGRVTRIRL